MSCILEPIERIVIALSAVSNSLPSWLLAVTPVFALLISSMMSSSSLPLVNSTRVVILPGVSGSPYPISSPWQPVIVGSTIEPITLAVSPAV